MNINRRSCRDHLAQLPPPPAPARLLSARVAPSSSRSIAREGSQAIRPVKLYVARNENTWYQKRPAPDRDAFTLSPKTMESTGSRWWKKTWARCTFDLARTVPVEVVTSIQSRQVVHEPSETARRSSSNGPLRTRTRTRITPLSARNGRAGTTLPAGSKTGMRFRTAASWSA